MYAIKADQKGIIIMPASINSKRLIGCFLLIANAIRKNINKTNPMVKMSSRYFVMNSMGVRSPLRKLIKRKTVSNMSFTK
jgi:hypothetical protein